MSTVSSPAGFFANEFAEALGTLPEATRALRQAWFDRFAAHGLPTTREENWKYTGLTGLGRLSLPIRASETMLSHVPEHSVLPKATHQFVFVDGHYAPTLSHHALPPSVKVATAIEPEALNESAGLPALNSALSSHGLMLRLPEGIRLSEPVHLLFLSASVECSVFPRVQIELEAAAELTLVEEYLGLHDQSQFTNTVFSAKVAAQAALTHIKVQSEGARTYHLSNTTYTIEGHGQVHSLSLALGSLLGREDLSVRLAGEYASATLDGLYSARKRMHLDYHTEVLHLFPNCNSVQRYRGIADDAGRAVFNGRVYVAKDAQHTDAQQNNANLLLSDEAEIDTKPQLEIFADDVKCSHGATIGALNPNELFYLRSRGLDPVTARTLVTFAFAARVLQGLTVSEELMRRLRRAVMQALPGAKDIEDLF